MKQEHTWKGPIIDVEMMANAHLAHIYISNATNPTFDLSKTDTIQLGETATYIIALYDRVSRAVIKS